MPEILFAAEIALSGLYRSAPEPELNLFSSSRTVMAQLRTGPAQCIHRGRDAVLVPVLEPPR